MKNISSILINSNKAGLSYFNMPKAACTTIKNLLFFLETDKWFPNPVRIHKNIAFQKNHPLKAVENISNIKFTFVRNPGRRVFSAFIEKIWFSHEYSFPKIRDFLKESHGAILSENCTDPTVEHIKIQFKLFLNFVELNVTGKSPFPSNPHWQPQCFRIRALPPKHTLSFIGKVENYVDDMRYLLSRIGVTETNDILEKKFNEGPRSPFSFESVIDDEIVQKIRKIYINDYLAFGYNDLCVSGQA